MLRDFLHLLQCPYCGGPMRLTREVEADTECIRYGLLACRCFEFPIVDGILLLSLAKGYGGAEETLQPYVPLQVAAIKYLQRNDVGGLRAWIARHAPLAAELMAGRFDSYLEFSAVMAAHLESAIVRYLAKYSCYEVLGVPPRRGWRVLARRLYHGLRDRQRSATSREAELRQLTDFYAGRFFAPRVNALAFQLEHLSLEGRLLSLCCGQGVYENLLHKLGGQRTLVSVDGQFLNLLCTRHFIDPQGVYLCHDVQFPLPFVDGAFDGVFSSTCLPEIPAQRTFVREAIRVTADPGWTFFDSIWSMEVGAQRVVKSRYWRFCQNFFAHLEDYLDFFTECAGPERRIALDVSDLPARYLDAPRWITEYGAMLEAMRGKTDAGISVLVTTPDRFGGFRQASHHWLSAETLAVSPVFDVEPANGVLRLTCKPAFAELGATTGPKSFADYPKRLNLERARLSEADYRSAQFCTSVLVPLADRFDRDTQSLASLLSAEV